MTIYRIVHISDLHISASNPFFRDNVFYRETGRTKILDELILTIQEWDNIDAILVTGDIADSGTKKDIENAADFLYSKLNEDEIPLILLPGNHDRFTSYRNPTGSRLFDSFFKNDWNCGFGGTKSFYLAIDDKPNLAIICSDFCLKEMKDSSKRRTINPWTKALGRGRVYPERLKELIIKTTEAQKITKNIVWGLHFAPEIEHEPKLSVSKDIILIDANKLVIEALQNKVKHIFCGHSHQGLKYKPKAETKVDIYCNGTVAVYDNFDKHDTCFYLRKFDVGEDNINVSSIKYVWNDPDSRFEKEAPHN